MLQSARVRAFTAFDWVINGKPKVGGRWSSRLRLNLISCITYTKSIFKQSYQHIFWPTNRGGVRRVGWKWATGGILVITCPFFKVKIAM